MEELLELIESIRTIMDDSVVRPHASLVMIQEVIDMAEHCGVIPVR